MERLNSGTDDVVKNMLAKLSTLWKTRAAVNNPQPTIINHQLQSPICTRQSTLDSPV